ncbi:acyl-CoA carboxylase subunit epsilon [Corynebacterium silvaticum]|uniref:Acyl-CoA carboxylase subunit epsilon n=1 Tax=Corynebacterium silvaticum TaxID=2320431 RepID=A0A7Y4LHZ2_9CORY|nr:acyl-CoA carboxylase subunit epsilon [Corynebacterium silvaticum]ARU45625.1 acyl-CoA carboxylase subunit epsilon [Corynebacterium silvaticum]MBH5300214.1 acyl-CoA carboxylase subunit epsilon [Corynebacterium silvaticum]NOM65630.1 acyl-CoA carboxylase subunit epsilon [Corynebacterium silvaticum]NON70419.1 acyl-CoA carboxylase subunit epsilon [Corynebacterium silvaticum]TFA92058.1 acyl-CoA carboxylase subunit epsilon [Corynebacterium silvaticum]
MSDTSTTTEEATSAKKPFLTVVKGNPDNVQVAAITTVIASLAQDAEKAAAKDRDRNLWGSVEERLQRPTTYNPTAFRNVSFY